MAKKKIVPSKRFGVKVIEPKADYPDDLGEAKKAIALQKSIIDLSKPEIKEMSTWVKLRIESAKKSKVWIETKERIQRLREAYENGVARTSTEMKGAHDYRTKLAASQTDAMTSRILNIFSVDPLLKFEGRNEMGRKNARNIELYMDYHHDIQAKLAYKGDEISSTLTIEGHVVLYTPWALDIQKDKPMMVMKQIYADGSGKEFKVDVMDKMAVEKAKTAGAIPAQPERFIVEEMKKTQVIKNSPDLKVFSLLDYLCPEDAKPGLDKLPKWEAVRMPFTMDELEAMETAGQIYPGILKEVKNFLKKKPLEMERPVSSAGNTGGEDRISETPSEEPLEKDALDAILPCWVVWGQQKVPGKKGLQSAVTIFHEDSGWVLQTRFNVNIDTASPMFHLRVLMIPHRWAGMGIMEMAYDGERSVNDLANFVLDEGRIFSCLPYKYKKKKFPGGIPPFEFWKGLAVNNMDDLQPLNFGDRRTVDINVASFVRSHMERRTGQGDLQLGRESDVTGKTPPTARGIISILREGQVRYTKANFGIINELVRMGQFEVKLMQQWLGSESPAEVLDDDGKDVFPDGVSRHQILGSYYVTANMAAQQMSRELDAELNIQLYELLKDNPFIVKSMSAYYDMTVDVLKSLGKKNLWVRPLAYYQSGGQQANGGQGSGLTPQEQQFMTQLLQAGVPMEVAKQKLEEMRGNAPGPEQQAEVQGAEQQILTQGQGAA